MTKPIILALDLGSQLGWAVSTPDGNVYSGSVSFAPGKHGGHGGRFLAFVQFLIQTKQNHGGIDAVYYEDVKNHAGVLAAHAYGGFLAMLQTWCATNKGVRLYSFGVGQIKKAWTGKGNAKKETMIEEARRRGFVPKDDNHADALAILSMACSVYKREFPESPVAQPQMELVGGAT